MAAEPKNNFFTVNSLNKYLDLKEGKNKVLFLLPLFGLLLFFGIAFTFPLKSTILSTLFSIYSSSAQTAGIDLDVTYIERTPRYYRYQVVYNNGIPSLQPGTENNKRWPDAGEQVTYAAHIKNKGEFQSPAFSYLWKVNGAVVQSGTASNLLNQGEEAVVTFQTTWKASPESIEFIVDPQSEIAELFETNNALSTGSHDLTISYWVERGYYDLFNNTTNIVGTKSFEDWIQAQYKKMNERFALAVYPSSPNGITNRVRIDKIVIADELDGSTSPMRSDPDQVLIDGRWQSSDGDPTNASGNGGNYQNYVTNYANVIDWGLIHESVHQLGVIDLYRMNLATVSVLDINGQQVQLSNLPLPVFPYGGVMGGGDTSPYNDGTYFDSHAAGALNSHADKRRGYYGEYLFDTPETNKIKVIDRNGNPVANAQVALYQKDASTEVIDNTPEASGITDSNGLLAIPNRSTPAVTTATGHTLKPNPFGQINVVGTNGTMIGKVTKDNKEGYGFYLLHDLNLAYWSGNTTNATVTIKSNYPQVYLTGTEPENLALNKPVTASSSIEGNGWFMSNLTDGNTATGWSSNNSLSTNHTEWVRVDLGLAQPVDRVTLSPRVDKAGLYFPIDFTIQLSEDGVNYTTAVTKTNYPNPGSTPQSFAVTPGLTRYIKIEATNLWCCEFDAYRMQLSEIGVYSDNPSATPTPTVTPTPTFTPTPTAIPTPTPTPDTPPLVSILTPTNGSTVQKNRITTISANASDDNGVVKVEFYVNSVLTCTDTTVSYTCAWKVPNRRGASFMLQARAFDTAGNSTLSSIVTVTSK